MGHCQSCIEEAEFRVIFPDNNRLSKKKKGEKPNYDELEEGDDDEGRDGGGLRREIDQDGGGVGE